jgi:hypothetical protein
VRHQNHRAGILIQNSFDGRDGGADAGIIGDLPALNGDVEVHAHQHALAPQVYIADGFLVHGFPSL